jgi:hypothetical protein
MSYAEFATVLNNAGSSYAYVFYALGELPAVVAAWFICLEYGIRYNPCTVRYNASVLFIAWLYIYKVLLENRRWDDAEGHA